MLQELAASSNSFYYDNDRFLHFPGSQWKYQALRRQEEGYKDRRHLLLAVIFLMRVFSGDINKLFS